MTEPAPPRSTEDTEDTGDPAPPTSASRARRRGGISTPQLVILIVVLAVLAVLLLLVAILIGRRTGTVRESAVPPGTSGADGGALVQLAAVTVGVDRLTANRFCEQAAGAAVSVLECELRPVAVVDASRCPASPRPSATTAARPTIRPLETDQQCAPADRAVATQLLGWVVSARGAERRVSIYLGPAPGEPSTVPDSVPRVVEPTLLERFRATDLDGRRWSEVAVCPRDVDRDGILDLVVEARPTDGGRSSDARPRPSATPEVVVLFPPLAGVPERSRGPLRSYRFDVPWSRDLGRGCASPAVWALGFTNDRLTLPPLASLGLATSSTTTTSAPAR